MASPVSQKIIVDVKTEDLAKEIKKHASESRNEEDIKLRVESLLRSKVFDALGIPWASYEHKTKNTGKISGVRKDALYGTVIIEYKSPGVLDSKSEFEKAKSQIKKYINEEAKNPKYYGRYFGVILDGYKISFVRYRKDQWEEQDNALEVNASTILRLIEAVRGLKRKPLDVESLLIDFGPKSESSKKAINVLYNALKHSKSERTKMLFKDWKRVFSQVVSYSPEKLQGLVEFYELQKGDHAKLDVEELLFAIHTYYTLLMKLLTSEIVTLFTDSLLGSYLKKLEEDYYQKHEAMRDELKEIEEGGIFNTVGIKNFLEADYFDWYIDEWDKEIADSIFEIVKKLLDYEPATVELNPERVKDLFKRLYQNLVPRDIRHSLGEYFTPDWLAELLLDEVGYDGNPEKKILDPACGSGTFLVLAIKRIRQYAEDNFIDKSYVVKKILENVRGIDLNPLAVLASKANFLIALSDLLRYRPREGIEIPIYLADSISVERTVTLTGEAEFTLHTTEGKFWVTREVIDKKLLYPVLSLIDHCVRDDYSKEEFEKLLNKNIPLSKTSVNSFIRLYKKILDLEKFHKNRIWTSLLKNSFSPLLMGKFDFVVGNPPWINWDNLPEFYRNTTKNLWSNYGLIGQGLKNVKRDISMLFVARCFDLYLNNQGKLTFLIPFTLYKTQAGAGFRNWIATKCEIEKIHDLVETYPFEGAINRTSMILIKKGKTKFPIPCIMWSNPRYKGIAMEEDLKEVKKITKQFDMIFTPVKKGKVESPWMMITTKAKKAIENIVGESPQYQAYAGVLTGLNGVYWINIISDSGNEFLVENMGDIGKTKVKKVKKQLEKALIYPLIRGRDVTRWYSKPSLQIITPHDKSGHVIKERNFKLDYPRAYDYFAIFKSMLKNRTIKPLLSKENVYPFYGLDNIGKRTFSNYKVLWKRIAGGITGKAVSFASAVVTPFNGKPVIPNDSLILIPFNDEREAYYVSGILNSSPVLFTIASYTYELRMETHITQYIKIPKFSSKDNIHIKLSELSKKAHELAKKYYERNDLAAKEDLIKIEEEIDKNVVKLYGITDEELEEIKKTLKILKGEGPEEEEASLTLPKLEDVVND